MIFPSDMLPVLLLLLLIFVYVFYSHFLSFSTISTLASLQMRAAGHRNARNCLMMMKKLLDCWQARPSALRCVSLRYKDTTRTITRRERERRRGREREKRISAYLTYRTPSYLRSQNNFDSLHCATRYSSLLLPLPQSTSQLSSCSCCPSRAETTHSSAVARGRDGLQKVKSTNENRSTTKSIYK